MKHKLTISLTALCCAVHLISAVRVGEFVIKIGYENHSDERWIRRSSSGKS